MKRSFKDLSAAEVLALAVSLEEEDARLLEEFARRVRPNYPKAAASLDAMGKEEDSHRHRLTELFRQKYGPEIPLVLPYSGTKVYTKKKLPEERQPR